MKSFVLLTFFTIVCANTVFHTLKVSFNSTYADEEVILNAEENYGIVIVSKVHGNGRPTINLHDFKSGYSAFKDVNSRICYVEKTMHTLEELANAISKNKNGDRDVSQFFEWGCLEDDETAKISQAVLGKRIVQFCESSTLQFVKRIRMENTRRSIWHEDESSGRVWCLVCVGSIGCEDQIRTNISTAALVKNITQTVEESVGNFVDHLLGALGDI